MKSVSHHHLFDWALLGYLALCVILGGASQGNDLQVLVLRLTSLPVLGWAVWRLWLSGRLRSEPLVWLALAFVALHLIQLVPLPPIVWESLPGRTSTAEAFRALGVRSVWRPMSLAPNATLNSLLSTLPFVAILFGALTLRRESWKRALWLIVLLALGSVLLTALQLAAGTGSPLRFYELSGASSATGFFANRNHQALFLVMTLPLLMALTWSRGQRGRTWDIGLALLGVALLVGVALTGSRAGAVLLAAAGIGWAGMLAFYGRSGAVGVLKYAAMAVLAIAIVAGAGAWVAAPRFERTPEDPRLVIWERSLELMVAHFPTGAGAGAFPPAYAAVEPVSDVTPAYVNHAHSDLLELLIEFGLLGGLFIVAGLAWFVMQIRYLGGSALILSGGAALSLTLAVAHSLVDYPLRTIGLAAVAAICAGLLSKQAYPRTDQHEAHETRPQRTQGA